MFIKDIARDPNNIYRKVDDIKKQKWVSKVHPKLEIVSSKVGKYFLQSVSMLQGIFYKTFFFHMDSRLSARSDGRRLKTTRDQSQTLAASH